MWVCWVCVEQNDCDKTIIFGNLVRVVCQRVYNTRSPIPLPSRYINGRGMVYLTHQTITSFARFITRSSFSFFFPFFCSKNSNCQKSLIFQGANFKLEKKSIILERRESIITEFPADTFNFPNEPFSAFFIYRRFRQRFHWISRH